MTYIELVPTCPEELRNNISLSSNYGTKVSGYNFPDIPKPGRMSSLDALQYDRGGKSGIPHIRARDYMIQAGRHEVFDEDRVSHLVEILRNRAVNEILVVQGDSRDKNDKPEITPRFIKFLKTATRCRVFAAIDQYRSGDEEDRTKRKIDAGADGFFTQPFFSRSDATTLLKRHQNTTIYPGICPVVTEKSRMYWENTNRVVFPNDFDMSEKGNFSLARDIIETASDQGAKSYIMPIRFDLKKYLDNIF